MHRRLLLTNVIAAVLSVGAAHAADLPARMPVKAPVVAAPVFSWTGFYIGAHAGYGWGKNDWSNSYDPIFGNLSAVEAKYDVSGGLAGGQIGFNYQVNQFVFGVEADASWANIKGDGNVSYPQFNGALGCVQQSDNCTSKIDALGTITGRVGVAYDRALFYAKGGAAWARSKHTAGSHVDPDPAFQYSTEIENTRWGWTLGAGIEYAFAPNWSAKIEYNYLDLGNEEVTFAFNPNLSSTYAATLDQSLHIVKAGINYRFWGN
ncbi:outer membrane protein [Rhodoplanes roseus]|nr:outer membrane protein [Rhodoplanes roseus]